MPRTIQNAARIEEKYREVLEDDKGNLTLGYKEKMLFDGNNKQYVEYMTGISIEDKMENGKPKRTVKENDTFHFISLEKITELYGGKPDYMTALELDCKITGRSGLMDFNKEPTNMDAIITPPYDPTTVTIDLARLEYMVMPHNISGTLNYNGNTLPNIDENNKLDGEYRKIAKSAVYDDLKVILPKEEYIQKHKDKLGYGQLHSLIAAGDKVVNKNTCIDKIIDNANDNIINQQYAEDPTKSWTINPWKENTSERWFGPTPLHVAIEKRNVEAVIALMANGARTNMVSSSNENMTQMQLIKKTIEKAPTDSELRLIQKYMTFPALAKREMLKRMEAEKAKLESESATSPNQTNNEDIKHIENQISKNKIGFSPRKAINYVFQSVAFIAVWSILTVITGGAPILYALAVNISKGIENLKSIMPKEDKINFDPNKVTKVSEFTKNDPTRGGNDNKKARPSEIIASDHGNNDTDYNKKQ